MPPQENITLDGFNIENDVEALLDSNYPCNGITVANTDLGNSKLRFRAEDLCGLFYPTVNVTLKNVITKDDSVIQDEDHIINIKRAE